MSSVGSVTHWLGQLKNGEAAAAQKLWEAYYQRLVALTRKRLGKAPRRAADEEDVALSAFNSFFKGAAQGKFPRLDDRNDLWRLLVRITACKVLDQITHERREKRRPRGAAKLVGESAIIGPEGDCGLDQIVGRSPSPEFAAMVADEYQRLSVALGDKELQSIALWKLEGRTDEKIAIELNCSVRTVERKLRLIRSLWARQREP
jgi:DNA-directed RNA polymerase specialized sigma24 family protein